MDSLGGCSIKDMAKAKKLTAARPVPLTEEEDEATLAAIDEGIENAKAGRTVPLDEVRKSLTKWTTASTSRKGR